MSIRDSTPLKVNEANAVLTASRALLGIIARSVASALEEVTLPQLRVLVLLNNHGPLRMGALAERLNANPSTFTRSMDRMVNGGWVEREPNPNNRREVLLALTAQGRDIVDAVTKQRSSEIVGVLGKLSAQDRKDVLEALNMFNSAAGETTSEDLLTLGFETELGKPVTPTIT